MSKVCKCKGIDLFGKLLKMRASDVRVREGQKTGTEVTKKSSFSASDTHVRGSKTHFLSPSQNGNCKVKSKIKDVLKM